MKLRDLFESQPEKVHTKEIKAIAESLKRVHNPRLRKYAEEMQQVINATAFLPLTAYEFYGDYWHGNPSIFGGGLIDRYRKTLRREARIINMGYNIISVWETDFESVINNNMKKARNENGI